MLQWYRTVFGLWGDGHDSSGTGVVTISGAVTCSLYEYEHRVHVVCTLFDVNLVMCLATL